jgi:hypothetical protein
MEAGVQGKVGYGRLMYKNGWKLRMPVCAESTAFYSIIDAAAHIIREWRRLSCWLAVILRDKKRFGKIREEGRRGL